MSNEHLAAIAITEGIRQDERDKIAAMLRGLANDAEMAADGEDDKLYHEEQAWCEGVAFAYSNAILAVRQRGQKAEEK